MFIFSSDAVEEPGVDQNQNLHDETERVGVFRFIILKQNSL